MRGVRRRFRRTYAPWGVKLRGSDDPQLLQAPVQWEFGIAFASWLFVGKVRTAQRAKGDQVRDYPDSHFVLIVRHLTLAWLTDLI
jgi:hypothetical protein